MAFFRNVQVRWMPIKGDSFLTIALERPGASGDQGDFEDRIELQNIKGHFPAPDLSAEWRLGGRDWGYVEIAGIVRYIEWDDLLDDQFDLSGDEVGWGLNLSSNIKLGDSTIRWSALYGEGIENYMNDAPADVGIRINSGNPRRPIEGELLPVLGISAFIDLGLGRACQLGDRLLAGRHRQLERAVGRRLQDRPVRDRQHHVLPGQERDDGTGAPVGRARELQGRLHVGRLPHPVLRQVQLQPHVGRKLG